MNSYCRHKAHHFFEIYQNRSFDQDDIALFTVLTRDYSEQGSILRELGDFLAHPDEKDRGLVLKNVKQAASHFENNCLAYFHDEAFEPPLFKGLGTLDELSNELKRIFIASGVWVEDIEIDGVHFRDFVFGIIFLLSSFRVKLGDRLFNMSVEYAHGLTLYISYESLNFPRRHIRLPVMFLGNVWIENISPFGGSKSILKDHIARRFEEGFLGAVHYDDDPNGELLSAARFERGKIWPLPS
ncbi:hypothetical protein [Salinicola halimionae]|uniref:hypothetical protein n=1 Tax=Salinicola halimionae TaxID=1949081 RepID=UPI001300A443|nr:hypothetical protein [Salinicola halimionae]